MFGRCLGGVYDVFEWCLKGFGKCLGGVWEVFGRCLRGVREVLRVVFGGVRTGLGANWDCV